MIQDTLQFDEEGNLITAIDPETPGRKLYIPAKHVEIIRKNFRQGKKWSVCSPVYYVTREQFAFIVNRPDLA